MAWIMVKLKRKIQRYRMMINITQHPTQNTYSVSIEYIWPVPKFKARLHPNERDSTIMCYDIVLTNGRPQVVPSNRRRGSCG